MRGTVKTHALAVATLFAVVVCAAAQAATVHPSAFSRALFAPVVKQLSKSAVPVLLPGGTWSDPSAPPLIAIVHRANAKGYDVELAYTADCNYADACTSGEISGTRIDGRVLTGTALHLPIGATGFFIQGGCGASCAESTITFDLRGYRYVFASKGGLRELRALTQRIATLAAFRND